MKRTYRPRKQATLELFAVAVGGLVTNAEIRRAVYSDQEGRVAVAAVHEALKRLEREGAVVRVSRGLWRSTSTPPLGAATLKARALYFAALTPAIEVAAKHGRMDLVEQLFDEMKRLSSAK